MSDWYYLREDAQKGPVSEAELKGLLSSQKIPTGTLVWKAGMESWIGADQLPEFSFLPEARTIPQVEAREVSVSSVVLEQKNFLRGKQKFELLDDQRLRFQTGRGKTRREGLVRLADLNPQPERIKKWDVGSLVIAIIMVLLSLSILLGMFVVLFDPSQGGDIPAFIGINLLMIGFTSLLVGNAYLKRQNSVVFTLLSGERLVLWFENPSKKEFDEFLSRFQLAISHVERSVPLPPLPQKAPVCANCQSPQVVAGFRTPLCKPCRLTLVNHPIPRWLKITAGALGVLMLISAIRIPREVGASVDFERGRMADKKGDYASATSEYQKALASYPKALDILSALALSAHRAGQQDLAMQSVTQILELVGPKGEISKDTVSIINEVRGGKP